MEDSEINVLIDEVQDIRETNNGNWMDILKIALRNSPDETRTIISNIIHLDKKVTERMEESIFRDLTKKEDQAFILERDFLRWLFIIYYKNERLFEAIMDYVDPWFFTHPLTLKVYLRAYNLCLAGESCDILSVSMGLKESESEIFVDILQKKFNLRQAEKLGVEAANKIILRNWQVKIETVKLKIETLEEGEKIDSVKLKEQFEELKRTHPKILEINDYCERR